MADKTTSSLTAAGTLDGTEKVALVQSGNSRRTTIDDILAVEHAHAIADVTGLQAAIDAKLDDSQAGAAGLAVLAAADTTALVAALGLGTAADTDVATTTEVLTGTATDKTASPDALAALWEKGSDIASSGTISVGEGGFFHVTGTTTITDIDPATDKAGRAFVLVFDGVLTLTHHATTLILPTGANITTAAGDVAMFRSEGSDAVRCIAYQRADGTALVGGSSTVPIQIACSDETTALTAGTAKATFRMPFAGTLTGVRANVGEAPTGSVLTVDINEAGSSVLSTKLTIDAGEKTSTTAATPAVISDSALADDAEITIDIDGVGSTIAGAGLKVTLLVTP